MDIPVPEQELSADERYRKDMHTLARAQHYIARTVGDEAALDYMISEAKKYAKEQKFSDHCYEYAEKEPPQLTESELAEVLPKNDDGKPIFSYRDL